MAACCGALTLACIRCGGTSATLVVCKSCKAVLYCSVDCAKEDFPAHKQVCTPAAAGQDDYYIREAHEMMELKAAEPGLMEAGDEKQQVRTSCAVWSVVRQAWRVA